MSGHMTRMSRGSRVGSSASRPSSTSRSTSTCRAAPWQRAPGPSGRSVAASGPVAGRRWRRCRTAASRAGCRAWSPPPRYSSVRRSAGRLRCSSRRSRPRVASSGWCTAAVAGVLAAGDRVRARRASARQSSSLGCGSHRCTSWWVASASSSSISVTGSRVCPNSDSRGGRSSGDSRRRATVFCVPDVRRVGVDAVDEGAPQRRLPAEVVVEVGQVAVEPVDEQLRALSRVGGEEPGEATCDGVAPAPAAARPRRRSSKWPRWVARVSHHGSSRLSSITSSSGQTMTSGAHGSSSAVPVISAISECGVAELDARAHPVGARAAAKHVGEPLAQPPLDRRGRTPGPAPGERVGRAVATAGPEAVGEQVGAIGAVQVQGHRGPHLGRHPTDVVALCHSEARDGIEDAKSKPPHPNCPSGSTTP